MEGKTFRQDPMALIIKAVFLEIIVFGVVGLYMLATKNLRASPLITLLDYIVLTLFIIQFTLITLGSFYFWYRTSYKVTENSLEEKNGILNTHLKYHPFSGIESTQVLQGIFGKIFNYSDLIIVYKNDKHDEIANIPYAYTLSQYIKTFGNPA